MYLCAYCWSVGQYNTYPIGKVQKIIASCVVGWFALPLTQSLTHSLTHLFIARKEHSEAVWRHLRYVWRTDGMTVLCFLCDACCPWLTHSLTHSLIRSLSRDWSSSSTRVPSCTSSWPPDSSSKSPTAYEWYIGCSQILTYLLTHSLTHSCAVVLFLRGKREPCEISFADFDGTRAKLWLCLWGIGVAAVECLRFVDLLVLWLFSNAL